MLFKITLTLFISASIFAAEKPFKSCDTTVNFDGESHSFSMQVYKNANDSYSGSVKPGSGEELAYEVVTVKDYQVRSGLKGLAIGEDPSHDNLNPGESLVVHALSLEVFMPTGLELKLINSITVYEFLEEGTNIGTTAFAEGFDENGKSLGSFMGGFFVSACK